MSPVRRAGVGVVLGLVSAACFAVVFAALDAMLDDLVAHGGTTHLPVLLWFAVLGGAWLLLATSVFWVPLVLGGFGLAALRCVDVVGCTATAAAYASALLLTYAAITGRA